MYIMVIIIYILIVFIDYIPLYNNGIWKDFWVNVILGVFSFGMLFLISLNVEIPSPSIPIQQLVTLFIGK